MKAKNFGLWILALILTLSLGMTGFAEPAEDAADPAPASPREDLIALFDAYSSTEDKAAADGILEQIQADPLGFLSALAAVENREQLLMLVGTMGEETTPDGTTVRELLETVGKLPLNHCEREMLAYVIANMEATY